MDNVKKPVKVTHFINPNLFFLLDLSKTSDIRNLQESERFKPEEECTENEIPRIKQSRELVSYYAKIYNKWIRCEVDEIKETDRGKMAMLWAIDYGIPFATLNMEELVPLPKDSRWIESPVFHAGLSVLPAKSTLNSITDEVELIVTDRWSEDSLKTFKFNLDRASGVYFEPSSSIKDKEIEFGELFLDIKGKMYEMGRMLTHDKMAVSIPSLRFLTMFNRSFSAIIERCNDNENECKLENYADSVIFREMDNPAINQKPFDTFLREIKMKQLMETAEAEEIQNSIQKVYLWRKQNLGIVPDDDEESDALTREEREEYRLNEAIGGKQFIVRPIPVRPAQHEIDISKIKSPMKIFKKPEEEDRWLPKNLQKSTFSDKHPKTSIPLPMNLSKMNFPKKMSTKPDDIDKWLPKALQSSEKCDEKTVNPRGGPHLFKFAIKKLEKPDDIDRWLPKALQSSLVSDELPLTPRPKSHPIDFSKIKSPLKMFQKPHEDDMWLLKTDQMTVVCDEQPGTSRSSNREDQLIPLTRSPLKRASKSINIPNPDESSPLYVDNLDELLLLETSTENSYSEKADDLSLAGLLMKKRQKKDDKESKSPSPSSCKCSNIAKIDDNAEKWMRLEVGSELVVTVSSFNSCNSFFVQVIDDADRWDEMCDELNYLRQTVLLKDFAVGDYCLVECDDELNRAKIVRRCELSVIVFTVDFGQFIYFINEVPSLFEMPDEILNFMPFQAVNCRFADLVMSSDATLTNIAYQKIIKRICRMRMRVVKAIDTNPDLIANSLENTNCYEVELFEKETGHSEYNINNVLVKYQLADYDKNSHK